MGVTLIDNMSLDGPKYLDARQLCATKAQMLALAPPSIPDGFEVYCAELKGWYTYSATGKVDKETGKWHERKGGGGSGSGAYNVTALHPMAAGYYTLQKAIEAIIASGDIEDEQKPGMVIRFEVAAGVWREYEFSASNVNAFASAASWKPHGGWDAVKSVSLNGKQATMDSSGNVALAMDEIEVDESLNAESTNPVSNAAITARLNELERMIPTDKRNEADEDNQLVREEFVNKFGDVVFASDMPLLGGGGGDSGAVTTKIVLSASVDKPVVKEGGSVVLSYTYDHQYANGDDKGTPTGTRARINILIKRGTVEAYNETVSNVARGSYELDITKYLAAGTSDITITAETVDPITGNTQRKTAFASVKAETLTLDTSFNIATQLATGGYQGGQTIQMPFAVNGAGSKTVSLYVDGAQKAQQVVTRAGTTNGTFSLEVPRTPGRHTVQMVAEKETDGESIRSESIYLDILTAGGSTPFIGIKYKHPEGIIREGTNHTIPLMDVAQYDSLEYEFVAYDADSIPAQVAISVNGKAGQTIQAMRTVQKFSSRFVDKGRQPIQLRCGGTVYNINVDVTEGTIDIETAKAGLLFELSSDGRTNNEANPGTWEDNGVSVTMHDVDFNSSGWIDGSLKLINGAGITINHKLFAKDCKSTGLTFEFMMRVSNVATPDAPLMSCIHNGKGLRMTTSEIGFYTGTQVTYTNEDDQLVTRDVKLAKNYTEGEWHKVALTLFPATEGRRMELFIDGCRGKADIYDSEFSFQQDAPPAITIDSSEADVEIRRVRVYERALTDDEVVDNWILDQPDVETMMALYIKNNVLNDQGKISYDKVYEQGRGTLLIIRANKLEDVFEQNNKKADFVADIVFRSPFGSEYNFTVSKCYIRIQGTSSTKYPAKNIRVYLAKGPEGLEFVSAMSPDGKAYQMAPDMIAMVLYCLKKDYSDSSMSLNTGGAKLFNDITKEMGEDYLTPPQLHQYREGGNKLSAITVRQAIYGFPIDVFVAASAEDEPEFVGQYNFNNEKSKSGALFGMTGVDGFNPTCPIALEALNNTNPCCLLQSESDADVVANFDAGFEINFGKDTAGKEQSDGDIKYAALHADGKAAVLRWLKFIRDCKPAGADVNDLSTWVSVKFKTEADWYFKIKHLCLYYLWTDYHMSVDQRAKNILWRTWDGLIWYATYYDGDTQWGLRNDSFLVYLYDLTRDTWDAEAGKYAFEGHDSWLWCMLLANFGDTLREVAQELREKMTLEKVLNMFNVEQCGAWSTREFNKSGENAYILPAIQQMYGKIWPFIYAENGDNIAHRSYLVTNRFALLDAQYGTSNFTADNIDTYINRSTGDAADIVRITGKEPYAYGYGTNNSTNIFNTGIVDGGQEVEISITGNYTVNDPLRIYGASRIVKLDMTGAADHLKNGLDLAKCSALRELNLESAGTGSTGWWLLLSGCPQLRKLNVRNQQQVKTNTSTSTSLDLSAQTKLEDLDARGTLVQSVVFAKGAPLTRAMLPASIRTLRLESLLKLPLTGLQLESTANVTSFIFDNCPLIDWQKILQRCGNVSRVRITGIDITDDGTFLERYMGLKGVDADGNNVETCSMVGTVTMTRYLEDDELARYRAHYPELNIVQPEYTAIRMDMVAEEASISNLDNNTGYLSGKKYVMSGHVKRMFGQRHRVMGKITKLPTTRAENIAGVDVTVNNPDGVMTYYPLHDADSRVYADAADPENCTTAKTDGTEGDIGIIEPAHWFKGIYDHLNGYKLALWSTNSKDNMPEVKPVTRHTYDDLVAAKRVTTGRKLIPKATILQSYSADANYSVVEIDVKGFRMVRFPTVIGTSLVGSAFTDNEGNIVESVIVPSIANNFEAGMYIIKEIPQGATKLYFTILNAAVFDKVILSEVADIYYMEDEWHYWDAFFIGLNESTAVGSDLRSIVTGIKSTDSMSWTDGQYWSQLRGMQMIDWNMHNYIANLFYAVYGRRDCQAQCGAGQHHNQRAVTADECLKRGMTDTIGYDEASAIDPNATYQLINNQNPAYSWFDETDDFGKAIATRVNNSICLGYINIYGNKSEWVDLLEVNANGFAGKMRVFQPDGSVRMFKVSYASDVWFTNVIYNSYGDMMFAGTATETSNTNFTDISYCNTNPNRVVSRGYNYAHANGGVSSAYALNDPSFADTSRASRLAFRGAVVKAASVAAFKAAETKAFPKP